MQVKKLLATFIGMSASVLLAQQNGTFEDLNLPSSNSHFFDISPLPIGDYSFQSGDFIFSGNYDTTWNSWVGACYSNVQDSLTSGFGNQYAAITGSGYQQSEKYGVFNLYGNTTVKITAANQSSVLKGFYVTNATYAYYSMLDGDFVSKKFGGPTGDDPDFFKLTVIGYRNGQTLSDSVHFYLADYRFGNNTQDYIVNDWQFVNLEPLGMVDSIGFLLTSSDTGQFGMNTPAYFCVDNFTFLSNISVLETTSNTTTSIFPNPATDYVHISSSETIVEASIWNINGKKIRAIENPTALMIDDLSSGVYFIQLRDVNGKIHTQKLIKN